MRKKIGKFMMILGLGIILIPIIGSIYTYYKGQRLYGEYLRQLDTSLKPIETEMTTNEIYINPGKEQISSEIKGNIADGQVIGRIKIPSIKVDLLLTEGVSKQALKLGAGHIVGTALPGETGNCAIAGHRNYTFGQMFNRLNEVVLKDQIIIEMDGKSYTYEVSNIKLVKPEDISVLTQSDDKKEVTLITCHPIYRATHRLIITGELAE